LRGAAIGTASNREGITVDEQAQVGRSRRALLAGAAAALAGMAAGALGRPAPAWAASVPMLTEVDNQTITQTGVKSDQTTTNSAVLAAYSLASSARVYALFGQALSPSAFGVYGYTESKGTAIEGRSTEGIGVVGVVSPSEVVGIPWGTGVGGYGPKIGVSGSGPGTGVAGYGAIGVSGASSAVGGFGVVGDAVKGVAIRAVSSEGTALKVEGKARFNRSGRVSVVKNRAYVDVDLTAMGGLSGTSLCFANLAYPRSGVYVRAVRPNYPATGKMRIYLNKVASTTRSTPLSWLVLEGA
jgi:hypothetical protein